MNIFGYKIELIIKKNNVNEREIVKRVNKIVPKNAMGFENHILRIKEIRKLHRFFYDLKPGEGVSLLTAKNFADEHWNYK